MLLEDTVEIKWNYRNRKHLESKGYNFTSIGDFFIAKVSDLSTGSSVRVKLKCDYCGCEYDSYYYAYVKSHAMLNKDSCQHCSATKGREVNRFKRASKYFSQLKEICDERGYELITTVDEYTGTKMHIQYMCPKHGLQSSFLTNMLRGHMCNECGNESNSDRFRKDINDVEKYINSFDGNILLNKDEYINFNTCNLRIKCGKCGNEFITSLGNYKRMTRKQCDTCNRRESEGEEIIRKYLTDKDIDFIQEKRFNDCRDKHTLPFDFYLPEYNMCIEFDGPQHYRPSYGNDRYEKTKLHDNIKDEYCKNKSIYLLRIPYWDGHNIEQILDNEINKLNRIKI